MKLKAQHKKTVFFSVLVLLSACSGEETLKESQLEVFTPHMTPLDNWIETNYVNPYNIRVVYKWNQNTVGDLHRFLYPPIQERVQPILELVQKIWLETYSTVGGADFVKKIAPRELVLVGGINLDPTGTIKLGVADAGQRITLFETDYINRKNRDEVERFIHTIQHEYIHILNQNKPFDRNMFLKITPGGYTANWYDIPEYKAREKGFITAYAQYNAFEDFAEMAATMLVMSRSKYDALINSIQTEKARNDIKAKENLVIKYFKEAFNVDFNQLRAEAEKNTNAIIKG